MEGIGGPIVRLKYNWNIMMGKIKKGLAFIRGAMSEGSTSTIRMWKDTFTDLAGHDLWRLARLLLILPLWAIALTAALISTPVAYFRGIPLQATKVRQQEKQA